MSSSPFRPPALNYTIKTGKREFAIIVFFVLIFSEAGILPLVLFYSIRWGAHLDNTKNLAIITSLVGTYSGYKMARRSWYLFITDSSHQRRPLGASRFGPDALTLQIGLGMTFFFVPLIIGSSLEPGSVHTVAMSLPCFMIAFCFPLLITGLFPHRLKMPFRVSSMPAYTGLPPAAYTLVEDVVAVDGGGCVEFRQAWRIRYEHSAIIRRIVRLASLWWGASGMILAAAFIVIAWTTPDDIGYGICWGLPWLWAMVAGSMTVCWVHRELERETRDWSSPEVHKLFNLHIEQSANEQKVACEMTRDESDLQV
ncbi:hypothetical protein C8Q74DRAFT_1271293 [Fomes fomentarius]|nr:hypothetical protein C8Q74DRAFT_1271293 [Fomes fomentarius]